MKLKKTKMWMLHSFLEGGTKYRGRKEGREEGRKERVQT